MQNNINIRLCEHSIQRIDQRTNCHHFISNQRLLDVWNNGKNMSDIKNKDLKEYLEKKKKNKSVLKIYKDTIYFFSKPTKQNTTYLITLFKVPKKFRKTKDKSIKPVKQRIIIEPLPTIRLKT